MTSFNVYDSDNADNSEHIQIRPFVPLSLSEHIRIFSARPFVRYVGFALIIAVMGGYFIATRTRPMAQSNIPIQSAATIASTTTTTPNIKVYVIGAVVGPGVVSIAAGARVDDAIRAAGGIKDNTDISSCNLAAFVNDGETINVPQSCGVGVSGAGPQTSTQTQSLSPGSSTGKININTASESELETLPGVGPVLAKSIINYRINRGRFSSVSDLQKVKGIGPKKFGDLKDLVSY